MIELKSSKTTELSPVPDGRRRYSIDGFIGAVQMRKDGGEWTDIDPTWKDGKIVNAPYNLEVKSNEIIFTDLISDKVYSIKLDAIGVVSEFASSPVHESKQITFKNAKDEVDLAIIPYNTGIRFSGNLKNKVRDVLDKVNKG